MRIPCRLGFGPMRRHRLLPIPLALFLALAAAAPASAAEVDVGVVNFEFQPATRSIALGDTVVWRFMIDGHTTTATSGQAERWNSGPETTPSGQTFRHTFKRPGRFQYVCIPHAGFMKGTIQVGKDRVRDTVDAFRTKRNGSSVRISFELNEAATVSYKLLGPERKNVRRGRLGAGRHSFRVRDLDAGSYTGTLTARDDFDKSAKPKSSFVIP
jgi:plastocyanin